MAVISIDYNDGNKKDLGYKSVGISYNSGKNKKVFDSGNFVKDWYDCNKFIVTKLHNKEFAFSHSSSVGHFITDSGNKYDSAYLETVNEKVSLSYEWKNYSERIEFFVEEGTTPTWEELKALCGDKNKLKTKN